MTRASQESVDRVTNQVSQEWSSNSDNEHRD